MMPATSLPKIVVKRARRIFGGSDSDDYGDSRWEGVDPLAAYLRGLPDPEPIPEWLT